MSLEKYKKKRSFSKTPEPSDGVDSKEQELVFVVQKHDARHLHYDLRLEVGGVLKSWAVPKGIPRSSAEKKLAMMVEDHPFTYRTFEGVIPKGNYGAGEVIVWDRGVFRELHSHSREESEQALQAGIAKGKISVLLYGEKLRGEYALVKIKKVQDNSWLLIKKGDAFATREPFDEHSVVSGKLVEDFKQGDNQHVSKAQLEQWGAQKTPMLGIVRPMLAKRVAEPFSAKDWRYEIKWDGYRVLAYIKNRNVRLYSRTGLEYKKFHAVSKALAQMRGDFILDGEIVSLDAQGKSHFQNLQNFLQFGEGAVACIVFDILYYNGYDVRMLSLARRKEILRAILQPNRIVRLSEDIVGDGEAFFKVAKEQGLEGIIAKDARSAYETGKRSDKWLKIKIEQTQEVVVGGFTYPKGSRKYIGSLLTGLYDARGNLHYTGRVSVGSDERKLLLLWQRLDVLKSPKNPFFNFKTPREKITWVRPELVIESRFTQWTAQQSMRHPQFVGLREDKNSREVVFELIEKNPTKKTQTKETGEKLEINGIVQKISHRDKIFWPQEGITKGDVIAYYRSVARYILPHMHSRPQSLHRFPDGIVGQRFYQKNMPSVPEWIETIQVHSGREERDIHYMLCQKEADLVYMANLGCIEMHPWLSRVPNLDFPDFLVFDLDPLDISFDAVVLVAHTLHELLEELSIENFVKTSGATGMHIYVPTGARYTYDQVVQFARVVAMVAHMRIPDSTSIERLPKKRRGKVYIDFLQNRWGQTIAAPYSLRPLPGAPVSTPLHWYEVTHGLRLDQFTMHSVEARLRAKGDIWKGIYKTSFDMNDALAKINAVLAVQR